MKLIFALLLFCSVAVAQTTQESSSVAVSTVKAPAKIEFFGDDYIVKPNDAPAGPAKRMLDMMQRFRQAKTLDELKALYTRNNADWFDQNHKAMQSVLDQNAKPMEKRRMIDSKIFVVVTVPGDQGDVLGVAWGPAGQPWEKARLPAAVYIVREEDGVDKFDFALTQDPIGAALSKGQWAQFGAPRDVKGAPATKPSK